MTDLPEVLLRPMTSEDVPAILTSMSRENDPFNWVGHREPGWLDRKVAEGRVLTDDDGLLMVTAAEHTTGGTTGGTTLGFVAWHRRRTGSSPYSWCWNIGIVLLPEHRGRGYGAAAQRAVAAYLFDTTPTHRVEAGTEVDNVAEQRALERAGFRREGVLRGYGWRGGAWRDGVLYSVLRGEL